MHDSLVEAALQEERVEDEDWIHMVALARLYQRRVVVQAKALHTKKAWWWRR